MLCVFEVNFDPALEGVLVRTPAASEPSSLCSQQKQGRCLPSIAIRQRLGWNEVLSERRLCAGHGQLWSNIRRNCQCCFAVSDRGQVTLDARPGEPPRMSMDRAQIFEALVKADFLIYGYHYTVYLCPASLKSKFILIWQGCLYMISLGVGVRMTFLVRYGYHYIEYSCTVSLKTQGTHSAFNRLACDRYEEGGHFSV